MTLIEVRTFIFNPSDTDKREFKVIFDGTRKKFSDLLEEYMTLETIFRPVKFKIFIQGKGHLLRYEVI